MLVILSLFFCRTKLHTQPEADLKRDFIWLFGYGNPYPDTLFGNIFIDFQLFPPTIFNEFIPMNFSETNASICDETGNLLFYTNGIYIANAFHNQMLNGGGLSPGQWTNEYAEGGMIISQGALILPIPESINLYVVFHGLMDIIPGGIGPSMTKVYYSIVDMQKANGLGAVVEKNIPIIQDTLDYGKITAVRHGNGRDWWILVPEFDTNRYYTLLLTPDGVQNLGPQSVGEPVLQGLGQACFSPDGSKYVRYDLWRISEGNFLNFYDFDRCTGELSNQLQLQLIDSAYAGGVAISPNSRFAYFSSYNYVYQYDMWADDIAASKDTVAVYDGFTSPSPLPTRFFLAQLAPNGKIYISCNNSVDILHVIHNPDEKGDACNLEQHGIQLPTLNAFTMPNFPNFRLGELEGSSCDTILVGTSDLNYPISDFRLYPNPAKNKVYLEMNNSETSTCEWKLYNALGQLKFSISLNSKSGEVELDISDLLSGVYFYSLANERGVVKSGSVIVVDY